ncbi:hypothetical protein ABT116_43945, partial [Streptomyces sp. NPDC002130]
MSRSPDYDVRGSRRIRYAAPAPAPNSAPTDTAVASQVAPSQWALPADFNADGYGDLAVSVSR